MYQLAVNDYDRVMPLLATIPFNVHFAKSVLADKVAGLVLVDNIANPQTAYIRHDYGMSLLCGSPDNQEFNHQLLQFLQNDHDFSRPEYLQVFPDEWSLVLANLLGSKLVQCDAAIEHQRQAQIIEHVRVNFKFNPEQYRQIVAASGFADYDIRQLDAAAALAYSGLVVPRYYWRDEAIFNQYALAYGLYINDELATVAFSSCRDEHILELGMETTAKFQKQGLAVLVCLKLIDETLKYGLEPVWACRKGNIGSYKLAHKVGFVAASEWPYYQIIRG